MSQFNFETERDSALLFIAQSQLLGGGFKSKSNSESEHDTVFYPALIGSILLPICKIERAKIIVKNVSQFLRNEDRGDQTYQYWSKNDPEHKTKPYPLDLDDTALVATLIGNTEPNSGPEIAARLALQLTRQEQKPGGPYYTWFEKREPPWNDIDPVVNASVHFTLQYYKVHLNSLESFLFESIKNNSWRSPYYASAWLNFYLIWRTFSWETKQKLKAQIIELKKIEPIQSLLDKACYVLIARENQEIESVRVDNFQPDPAIFEHRSNSSTVVSGAAALTAAVWALACHELAEQNPEFISEKSTITPGVRDQSTQLVAKKISGLIPELSQRGIHHLSKLLSEPISLEIILLSADFGQALAINLPDNLYAKLGAANLFGWLAFLLYDECYDEYKVSIDLSLANICLRAATALYNEAAADLKIKSTLILQTLDAIDQAHAREMSDTLELRESLLQKQRWTGISMRQVAERSFGHCLGPLLISESQGLPTDFFISLKKLFNHYLTARQICDDLHDWPEDFSAKRVTTVTKSLFFTTQAFHNINTFQAKKIFWNEGLDLAIDRARQEIFSAKRLLNSLRWPAHPPRLLEKAIKHLEESLNQALSERKAMKSLITNF